MNLLVTGTVIQATENEDPCIKAARFFELQNFNGEEWNYEVKTIQNYLVNHV